MEEPLIRGLRLSSRRLGESLRDRERSLRLGLPFSLDALRREPLVRSTESLVGGGERLREPERPLSTDRRLEPDRDRDLDLVFERALLRGGDADLEREADRRPLQRRFTWSGKRLQYRIGINGFVTTFLPRSAPALPGFGPGAASAILMHLHLAAVDFVPVVLLYGAFHVGPGSEFNNPGTARKLGMVEVSKCTSPEHSDSDSRTARTKSRYLRFVLTMFMSVSIAHFAPDITHHVLEVLTPRKIL